MIYHKSAPLRVLLLLALVTVILGFKSGGARNRTQNKPEKVSTGAQAQSGPAEMVRLSAPAKPASSPGNTSVNPSPFDAAASTNMEMKTRLEWSFGGKLQYGWDLYGPLIGNMIGAGIEAAASEFAMRLSLWQKENGLEPTGVLDSRTWSQMMSKFQSRRINSRLYPDPSQLVTIPISDCYDPTRAEELRSAERETFAAYKRMVAAAVADRSLGLQVSGDGQLAPNEKLLKIISAFRSREYQEQLRRQSPHSGRAGLAINSPHFTGRALDLYVGGEPVNTKDANRALQTQGAVYRWLVKNAARFGFQPYFYEPWHWEYVGGRNDIGR
jgi:hypothetical protein